MTANPAVFEETAAHGATYRFVQQYYGQRIQKTSDLQATACCTDATVARFAETLRVLPEEVVARQYGCGSPLPDDDLSGLTVVDLGSGAGTDAFIAARLVGPKGRVIGIDMTAEQLEVARRNVPAVMEAFGHPDANIEFHEGLIEYAESVEDGTVDLVISNCVINLSPRKDLVFRAIHRMLRPGGELFFSDIVSDRRLPEAVRKDEVLYSECLSGADYEADLYDTMEAAGLRDVRTVSRTELTDRVADEAARFASVTLRAFKLPLDRRCEDYGQTATYLGTIPGAPVQWRLDPGHPFERDRPLAVCRNTAWMLARTRLAPHFRVTAEVKHFGGFDCGPAAASSASAGDAVEPCC